MKIIVLMSTYNGAAYLEPQVRSILDQDTPDIRLIIRDDGSRDATPDILRALAATDPRIDLRLARNVGLPRAFFELMRDCPPGAGLYLLADQDDIWHTGKIAAAARRLSGLPAATPTLYCGRTRLMKHDGTLIGLSPHRPSPPSFGNALIENICTGCTAAFNAQALRRMRQTTDLDGIMFHDWWLYLVASAFGSVVFDASAMVDYRLHDANVAGMPTGGFNAYRRRMAQQPLKERFANLIRQAHAFDTVYRQDLAAGPRAQLDTLLALQGSPRAAFSLIPNRTIFRQSRRDDLIWRAALALHGAGLIGRR